VLHLDDAAVAACARNSIVHSGAPSDLKAEAVRGIGAWPVGTGSAHS
jgi:hypothetical protein